MRSPTRRASFALARVVSIRSCWMRLVTRFRRRALRCECVRLSFLWSLRWRMFEIPFSEGNALGAALRSGSLDLLSELVLRNVHPEVKAHARQDVRDLLERLPAEVPVLEHLPFGLRDEVADGLDVGRLQAIRRPHRKLQLLDAPLEQRLDAQELLVDFLFDLLDD